MNILPGLGSFNCKMSNIKPLSFKMQDVQKSLAILYYQTHIQLLFMSLEERERRVDSIEPFPQTH